MLLRDYQSAAVAAADRALRARRKALLVMATGSGKTICFAALAERWRSFGRILVLAHREELLDQARDKIHASTLLRCAIEQGERSIKGELPDVVIASVQTLMHPTRRERFGADAFSLVVADEGHHFAKPAAAFVAVPLFFKAALLGVTATPDRADGAPLIFGPPSFRYGIRTAVRDGYLADVRRCIELLAEVDLSRVRVRAGDYDAAELEQEMLRSGSVEAVAEAVLRRVADRPTMLFCAGIAHSTAVAAALNARKPGVAAAASGDDRAGVAMLSAGRVQILAQTDLCTEGYDFPPLACVGLVRPTKSLGRATQQVGRGTRLAEGKGDLLVIEFVGAGSFDQRSTVDVVGAELPARVRMLAERHLDQHPGLSVLDALDRAAASSGAGSLMVPRRPRAVIDPMRLVLSLDGMVLEAPRPGAPPATVEQVRLLAVEGLDVAGLDVRQAALLLAGVRWRRARKRSSPIQALQLHRFGLDLECSAADALRQLAQMRAAYA